MWEKCERNSIKIYQIFQKFAFSFRQKYIRPIFFESLGGQSLTPRNIVLVSLNALDPLVCQNCSCSRGAERTAFRNIGDRPHGIDDGLRRNRTGAARYTLEYRARGDTNERNRICSNLGGYDPVQTMRIPRLRRQGDVLRMLSSRSEFSWICWNGLCFFFKRSEGLSLEMVYSSWRLTKQWTPG